MTEIEPQLVHPTTHATFSYNPSTQTLARDDDCKTVLNIADHGYDGTQPVIMYKGGRDDCETYDDSERFTFQDPTKVIATKRN